MSAEIDSGTSGIQAAASRRCYERSALIEQLQADIDELEKLDKSAEKHKGKAMWLTLSPLAIIFVTLLTAAAWATPVFVICGLVLCWGASQWIRWAKLDLSDFRYQFARELLLLCGRDITENSPATLKIEFKAVNRKETTLRKTSDRTIYKDTWLVLNGAFADGSKFTFQISETVHVKFRKGKYKAKGYVMSLAIAFSKKSYGVLQLENVSSKSLVKLDESTQLKALRGKGNALYLAAKIPNADSFNKELAINQFLLAAKYLLLSAYGILNSTKKSGASA